MPCCNCEPPTSVTNVYNTSLASSQVLQESHTLTANDTFTTTEIPADGGFFIVALNGVVQALDVDFTVDFDTGIVSIPGAVIGDKVMVAYIEA
jgi:hypothetical protein